MNIAIITGNIGKAEVKTAQSGTEYITGSVATSQGVKKDDKWENVTKKKLPK